MSEASKFGPLPVTNLFSVSQRKSRSSQDSLNDDKVTDDWYDLSQDTVFAEQTLLSKKAPRIPIRDRGWYAYAVLILMVATNGVHQISSYVITFLWTFIVKDIPFTYAE